MQFSGLKKFNHPLMKFETQKWDFSRYIEISECTWRQESFAPQT